MLERLQVRAGQLPVIVNTAIVPCPCGRDAAEIFDGSIDRVEAAGVTLLVPPLPPVELVLVEEPPVLDEPVEVLLVPELPVVPLLAVPVPVVPVEAVPLVLVGAVLTGVEDAVPVDEAGAVGLVGGADEVPSALGVEEGVDVTGVAVGLAGLIRLGGVPGPYSVVS